MAFETEDGTDKDEGEVEDELAFEENDDESESGGKGGMDIQSLQVRLLALLQQLVGLL